jgi:hypothetical protein
VVGADCEGARHSIRYTIAYEFVIADLRLDPCRTGPRKGAPRDVSQLVERPPFCTVSESSFSGPLDCISSLRGQSRPRLRMGPIERSLQNIRRTWYRSIVYATDGRRAFFPRRLAASPVPRSQRPAARSVVEESQAVEAHRHAVLVRGADHLGVRHGAACEGGRARLKDAHEVGSVKSACVAAGRSRCAPGRAALARTRLRDEGDAVLGGVVQRVAEGEEGVRRQGDACTAAGKE